MGDWAEIAAAAAADAGSPGELLGDFLPRLAAACATRSPVGLADLSRFRALGADSGRIRVLGNLKFDFLPSPGTTERGLALRA